MKGPPTFRSRAFLVLVLVALVPVTLTLVSGTLLLREVVISTGSAGPWNQLADSGRALLDAVGTQEAPSAELVSAAERHRAELAESVRLSRLYVFLGERILFLLPVFALALLALTWLLAVLAANRFAKAFSRPVEELVAWTHALGRGDRLPDRPSEAGRARVREFLILEEALRSAADALEEGRRREVERARMQSWSEMARMVAHEIKNPLTPMRMAADRVSRSRDPGLAEAGVVLVEEIDRLDALARSFSHFGKLPEGPMSRVDLSELLTGVARRLSTGATPIVVDAPESPVEVTAHLEALERVVRNLLANAQEAVAETAAADPQGCPVTPVEVVIRREGSGVGVRFLDRGPGIPPDSLEGIWQPEFTTKRKGTGLGLPMVRQAVNAHGGEVRAFNREGGGTEFRIWLPCEPVADDPAGPVAAPEGFAR